MDRMTGEGASIVFSARTEAAVFWSPIIGWFGEAAIRTFGLSVRREIQDR